MKILTLLFIFAAALVLPGAAAPSADSPLKQGVAAFFSKSRVLADNPFGKAPRYTLAEALKPGAPAGDSALRQVQAALVRDAAAISAELDTLAKLSTDAPADKTLAGQIQRIRVALAEALKDKAKAAELTRQLAALQTR